MINKTFFVLFLYSIISLSVVAQNDTTPIVREARNLYTGEAYRAFSLHADIFSPVMGKILNNNIKTFELQADANIYDKFFPTIEAGMGEVATTGKNGQYYESSSPFLRIGMNYSLLNNAKKDGTPRLIRSYPFVGVRYGMGVFNYRMKNIPLNSDYWSYSTLYDFDGQNVYAGWLEIVGGIRVDIYKGFTMGWSVRIKTAFHSKDKTKLWWTPGYGFTSGGQFAFNYTVGYTFRTKTERAKTAESK